MWIFPQGLEVEEGAATWSNHVMTSGVDDRPYLARILHHVRNTWGVDEVWLAGHSNGGMMVQRMWCEPEVASYDRYVSIAGPPSVNYDEDHHDPARDVLPCNGMRPYWAIVGDDDRVLQTTGNGLSPTWEIAERLQSLTPNAFENPKLINEARAHSQLRTPLICPDEDESSNQPTDTATRREWSNCGGATRLWWIRAADPYPRQI